MMIRRLGFEIPKRSDPTKEAIARNSPAFEAKLKNRRTVKKDQRSRANQEVLKLHFNGGRKRRSEQ
ncbi:hypothetical protein [Paenibacillus massiliensis]|uniref:hypothetical protein n=1 Tax=Paenibacillus massiliensis TaxID=225917 RepID=UPI00040EA339|nr:hypothetical protein [Paenibacillus massiliensis]